jgi:hypothetical protein
MNTEFFLSGYDESITAIAMSLREFLFSQLPGIREEVDLPARIISYSYGPGYKNIICVIILSKKGIKLGFYKGGELPDPEKLLTGTGKVHRYVGLKSVETLDDPALIDLLAMAVAAYQKRNRQSG